MKRGNLKNLLPFLIMSGLTDFQIDVEKPLTQTRKCVVCGKQNERITCSKECFIALREKQKKEKIMEFNEKYNVSQEDFNLAVAKATKHIARDVTLLESRYGEDKDHVELRRDPSPGNWRLSRSILIETVKIR